MNKDSVTFPAWVMKPLNQYDSSTFAAFLSFYNTAKVNLYKEKDKTYGGSWQKDGFIGAFLNLKRKIDRLLNMWQNGELLNFEQSGESILDTFADMENYSALCLGFIIFSIKTKDQYDMIVGSNPLFKNWIAWSPSANGGEGGVAIYGIDLNDNQP